ncbi:MAG: 30S ribosomal protein S1 [Bacteroidetes bacterium]|nr:30S ribosomal protein S1 [Bacteroidota bacterium]MBT4339076.1 30S ribosomal protein S1 [Bacteroidota bacterium]MBT5528109.1 30S ribosomal protein S1 [Cytophagia bacterium]MBT7826926.1 30S ribosomal protein S1 [Bacteroidota bacterium]
MEEKQTDLDQNLENQEAAETNQEVPETKENTPEIKEEIAPVESTEEIKPEEEVVVEETKSTEEVVEATPVAEEVISEPKVTEEVVTEVEESSPEVVAETIVESTPEVVETEAIKEDAVVEDKEEVVAETTEVEEAVEELEDEDALEDEEPLDLKKPFDWASFEEEEEEYGKEEKAELKGLYTKTLNFIEDMQLVNAVVENITDKEVVLNIGFKSDGLVALSEFKHMEDLKIGDEVEVIVESTEGRDGQLILSHRKARAESAWAKIVSSHETGEIVTGFIKDRTKGGMVVDLFGLDAFLPGSQLDIKPVQDYDAFVGINMELKVVKLNPNFRNIVVSHKAIIEQDIEQQRHKILSKLEKGQVLEGLVKNLTSFGVFIDLGGVDGLIHITDVSWGRINHPNELLEIGEKLNVVVLDYDEEKNRISLGMKQLTQHPWETLPEDIVEGSVMKGKVVNIEDYGAFVEIYPGVEGLVHVSEMTWSQHLKSPADYIVLNDEVEVKVLSIVREERKLSLGIKQLTPDPWAKVPLIYTKDSQHKSVIKNITNFGLFVELEEGIDGLIHISDLSWTKKFNHPSEFAKAGDDIEVVVLEIDEENRRLSLGHKQLEEDPWETFKDIFSNGSVHEGNVIKVDDKGAVVTLPYGVEGFCPIKQLVKEDESKVNVEDVLEFKVIEFDKSNRRIVVSHISVWKEALKVQDEEVKADRRKQSDKTRKAISQVRSKVQKTTLGSEQDVLQALKDRMTADENAAKAEAKPKKADPKKKADEEEAE